MEWSRSYIWKGIEALRRACPRARPLMPAPEMRIGREGETDMVMVDGVNMTLMRLWE